MWVIAAIFLSLATSLRCETALNDRASLEINESWRFHRGPVNGADAPSFDDASWTSINLPHTWNSEESREGADYYRGDGWYRKEFKLPPEWRAKRIYVEFDGANRVAEVFLNGHRLGEHRGGYARFRFDLTDAVNHDGGNLLAVRVSNAINDDIPPVTGDYTFFGGIYRKARLVATEPVHIEMLDHASPGIFATVDHLTDMAAGLSIRAEITNDDDTAAKAKLHSDVYDATGQVVTSIDRLLHIPARDHSEVRAHMIVAKPHLWNGRADPYLYRVKTSITRADGASDAVQIPLGIRTFVVDRDHGFFLNGKYLDLHGVNRHQARADKGWAISEEDERADFGLIEEMGCTFVRQSHYQQSQYWNSLADEYGMLMWAELAYTNDALDNPYFFENAKEQLRELIRQNSQHPSIFFWCIGNETFVRNKKTIPLDTNDRLLRELAAVAHEEDPSRLSTYASNGDAIEPRAGIPDVIAFNHYFGWYRDKLEDLAPWLDRQKVQRPDLCMGMSEFGAGANAFQHESSDQKPEANSAWHPEEWQSRFHEVYWQAMATRPWIWCKLVWCMFDFESAGRNEGGVPGINDKGLVSRDRTIKKDAFYWYKANWSNEPVLHITSQGFTERKSSVVTVKVYSNAGEVSLSINGRNLGIKRSTNRIFEFENVSLSAGKNVIEASSLVELGGKHDSVEWLFTP